MPTFFDFLASPWRVLISLIGSGGESVADAAPDADAAVQAGSQAICSVRPVGDQLLNVCTFAGYEMPAFIFWASLSILVLFLYASVRLKREAGSIHSALESATDEIRRHFNAREKSHERTAAPFEAAEPLGGADFEAISAIIGKHRPLRGPWHELRSTVLESGPESGNEVTLSAPLEQTMSRPNVVDGNISQAFFGAVPGVLTGVGLLMTFVAILDGLSYVSVSNDLEITGIGGLINGLSGKFVSSVVAIGSAVAFVFVERFSIGKASKAHTRFVEALSGRFRTQSAEQLLHRIYRHMDSQAAVQREMARTIAELRGETDPKRRAQGS